VSGEELPAPAVDPDVYDEDYYLTCCGGHETFGPSGGSKFAGMYPNALEMAGLRDGETVVDVGTGRGELLVVAVKKGASRAIGVEYAEAAVALARRTVSQHEVADRAEVVLADARAMPIDDGSADLVTMLDVVEHLTDDELARSFAEILRILRPGGRLFIHTFPTRTIYDVTYRALRMTSLRRRRAWPADPRNEFEHKMHVNEQTLGSMRRSLRAAGFSPVDVTLGKWVYTDHVPDAGGKRIYERLAKHRLTRPLGIANIFATAVKPASK
jgi:ubiquinone/menaquinone biosynthesis C-methylase UbiE